MKDRLAPLDPPDQSGRTWLVTGATNGVGRETARAASRAGARVLLTARDAARGEAVRAELGHARVIDVDFADLARVRTAAAQVDEPVDVLINCAGRMTKTREQTVDGFEAMLGTNMLGPFAFTALVADQVHGRVVIVGSDAHRSASLDFNDLQLTRGWRPFRAYGRSKLADMLWGLELNRRLAPRGIPVMLAHPGWALTNIQNQFGERANALITAVTSPMAQSAADGAQNVLMAATSDLAPCSYVGPSSFKALRGAPTLLGRSPEAADPQLARRLWDEAVQLTGTDLD
ncbi:SDR family NAD(P)-dependent oxidoreductase [Kocuria palustris]|uniref:SDR family NAD(P)-dependent oxidoreductase n=1 Tax=Kocuria palustris TaxID=71999 RepID=UPI00242E4988|nr:SDR family NAD(P)-dependent oxidoreductase [Kocuria palustris]